MLMNLHAETLNAISDSNHTNDDVAWVGTDNRFEPWYEFAEKADEIEYNNGYGWAYINTDLRVVFTDGTWLERYVYDGAEQWVHKTPWELPSQYGLTREDILVH